MSEIESAGGVLQLCKLKLNLQRGSSQALFTLHPLSLEIQRFWVALWACHSPTNRCFPSSQLKHCGSGALSSVFNMERKLLTLGLLLVAAFALVEGKAEQVPAPSEAFEGARRQKDNSFDFLFFVQQWPGSYCDSRQGCCFPVTGEPGPYFGIHGLWPNRDDGTYPATCSNEAFDPSLLADVIDNLNKNWGTLACNSKRGNEDFWEHEWSKHGTCSGFTQREYFQNSVDLYNDYDITGALRDAGIVPDDRFYSIAEISKAFANLLGFAPEIECNTDPKGNRQLYQVYICVAKDGKTLVECPASIRKPCQGSVQFPVFGSNDSGDVKPSDTEVIADELLDISQA
ncbi:ribonuclease 1 [Physcomitrium patens]|uniref:Uncharacterized protein n=1 Tax=Physcomitrium patens TaxID=3218 RepID=A0A2K1L1X4_PHYPA|nr:hypothetical protein PHYPA_002821 [Physcomitrium patens]